MWPGGRHPGCAASAAAVILAALPRRILLAAATAFAERGFHATTTRDIAALAGLSPAALYVYFRSKEEVLHQIAASTLDFTIEVAATEASRPGSPADRLAGLTHVLTLWHTYNSQVAHVVLYQTGALSPAHLADITAKQREVGQIVRQVIADGISSGDFDVPDPGAAAIAVLSLCLDVARWYRPSHRLTPQQLGSFNAVAAPPSSAAAWHDTRPFRLRRVTRLAHPPTPIYVSLDRSDFRVA